MKNTDKVVVVFPKAKSDVPNDCIPDIIEHIQGCLNEIKNKASSEIERSKREKEILETVYKQALERHNKPDKST